jgi:dihydrofolate reductase
LHNGRTIAEYLFTGRTDVRKLIATENISLDGVIDAQDNWFAPDGGDDIAAVTKEHMGAADAVLLGRVTYDQFASYWPAQTADRTGVSDYLNRTTKYVFSSTLQAPAWQHTTVLSGSLADEIARLKALPGRDIVATGSVSLVRSLASEDLIDVYRLFVYPVVLGRGRRLFPGGSSRKLRLIDSRTFRSGVVLLAYQTI